MNIKKYCMDLLSLNDELITLIGTKRVVASYPQEIKSFPLVIIEDINSNDVAFSDNLPEGTSANIRIHIFSKTLKGYVKAEEIAEVVHNIFRMDYWVMTGNQESPDVEDNIKHRIMNFKREFYSL